MSSKYPKYYNFINQYFKVNKLDYFKDLLLNYSTIPNDCRSNNYLENYNGFIKLKLGKHRIINWVDFINFIKEESARAIEKLFGNEINTYIFDDKTKIENKEENEEIINLLNTENINKLNAPYNLENIISKKIGIKNMGASCYINSCIQILIHLKLFMKEMNNKIDIIKNKKLSISYKFYNICIDYLNNENNDLNFIDISYFVKYFSNIHPQYTGELQSDSLEFLRVLLDDISLD